MLKPNIAYIDSIINADYLFEVKPDNIEIGGVFTINRNEVKICQPTYGSLTHASLCSKIFCDEVISSCTLQFINIFDMETKNSNIKRLLTALKWCLQNDINIINLSIGTTLLNDIPDLYEIINELIRKKIVIIAACSNDNKLTFPASFDGVISVKATNNKLLKNNPIFFENRIDRVAVECYVQNEVIQYNNQVYKIYTSNSFAAPIITAKLCDYMSQGYIIDKELYENIIRRGDRGYPDGHICEIREKYCSNISVPIIAIPYLSSQKINCDDIMEIVMDLLKQFRGAGYEGICLSDISPTNMNNLIFSLVEYLDFNLQDKIAFYSNYCQTSFIILHSNETNLKNLINENIFDIMVLDNKMNYDVCSPFNSIKTIYLSDYPDTTSLFKTIYSLLLD